MKHKQTDKQWVDFVSYGMGRGWVWFERITLWPFCNTSTYKYCAYREYYKYYKQKLNKSMKYTQNVYITSFCSVIF